MFAFVYKQNSVIGCINKSFLLNQKRKTHENICIVIYRIFYRS